VWQKFWPLFVLIGVGLVTLALLTPGCGLGNQGDRNKERLPPLEKLETEDLEEGQGEPVKTGDTVEVLYAGRLRSNNKEFDSSARHGNKPMKLIIGKSSLIKGWHEGLPGMKVGGKRKLLIPAKLAYGADGFPPDIPPNADLVFEIDLVRKLDE
jgi:FKBP-type peptidyl-prolyl cis-trans isomerase